MSKITDTAPFIDLGWFTVPLSGKLERLEDGTKTIPTFPVDWKSLALAEQTTTPSKLGGVMTGAKSGIVIVDCDNQATLDLFDALAPEAPRFESLGKLKGGASLLFKFAPDSFPPSFRLHNAQIDLDFLSDNAMAYLPTASNKTKKPWTTPIPAIPLAPPTVALMLHSLYAQAKPQVLPPAQLKPKVTNYNFLQPQLALFVDTEKFTKGLFKTITPYEYRDDAKYLKEGYLHPNDIPEGNGSDYLMRISSILGADVSVDSQLYYASMRAINNLWDSPIDRKRLDDTILLPMATGAAKINGKSIWQYDAHWMSRSIMITNKLGEAIELFFDDVRHIYYLINHTHDKTTEFLKDNDVFSYIETVGINPPPRKNIKLTLPVVRTVSDPSIPFGFFQEDEHSRMFNLFKQTPHLEVLTNPGPYRRHYTKPVTTIRYFESLIPDPQIREYVLRFIRRKLTTFTYSPVILYFLGVPGSGKDTFIDLLGQIIGDNHIAKPTAREFLEQYNGWLVDKYFVQLDEYGNQLSRLSDKEEALGKIKLYSGKQDVQIRRMRTDGFIYRHSASLILTANSNPLMVEENDRRLCLIDTPNKLEDEEWVKKGEGISKVHDKILDEALDWCFWLATEVEDMPADEYVSPPDTAAKRSMILARLPAARRIAYMIAHSMFDELEEEANEHGIYNLFAKADQGIISEDTMLDLYSLMTDGVGTKRGLNKVLQDAGIHKQCTTKRNIKSYNYLAPTLKYYTPFKPDRGD